MRRKVDPKVNMSPVAAGDVQAKNFQEEILKF